MLKRPIPIATCLLFIVVAFERDVQSSAQTPAQAAFSQGRTVADGTLQELDAQNPGALAAPPIGHLIAGGVLVLLSRP